MGRKLKPRSGTLLVRSGLELLHLHITGVQLAPLWSMISVDAKHLRVLADLWETSRTLKDAREVPTSEGKALAEAQGLFFMETSALDSSNVASAFETVVKEIYNILIKQKGNISSRAEETGCP
ncbi:Ras-related protein RABA5a [Linum perenne]